MPFSDETMKFLIENKARDSRPWFHEHKADYLRLVTEPMEELVRALTPAMLSIDPAFICTPKVGKTISRLWRDTRFMKNASIFRDVVWCSFTQEKYSGLPSIYFQFYPSGFDFGCGWYRTEQDVMEAVRGLILSDDPLWQSAKAAYDGQDCFVLEDSRYKKSRYPDAEPDKREWLDQKSFCLICKSDDFDLLYSDSLADYLGERLVKIKPVYEMFLHCAKLHPRQRSRRRESGAASLPEAPKTEFDF